MTLPVSLKEAVDLFDSQGDERFAYLNRKTGEMVLIGEEAMNAAENVDDPEEHPDWMMEGIAEAGRVLAAPDDWLEFPSAHGMPERRWMRAFALLQKSAGTRDSLLSALNRPHSYRRFREAAFAAGVRDAWYDFRFDLLAEELGGWLEVQGIPFE